MSNISGGDPVAPAPEWAGPAWWRLQQQIAWYDAQGMRAMAYYKTIKVLQLVAAASIPVVVSFDVTNWITGSIGSAIVVLEGIQQLFGYHEYWISYRSACEALRQETWLFEARAGIYREALEPDALLAERLHNIAANESARWAAFHTEDKGDRSR